jgi:hypothetical protein
VHTFAAGGALFGEQPIDRAVGVDDHRLEDRFAAQPLGGRHSDTTGLDERVRFVRKALRRNLTQLL